mmetsp:Transcript_19295/g.64677  ORF Transcript_19295/g.64677 Transcript_19295/m.64677 type:complete len:288 (+) Transcript_19295:87-950(+)
MSSQPWAPHQSSSEAAALLRTGPDLPIGRRRTARRLTRDAGALGGAADRRRTRQGDGGHRGTRAHARAPVPRQTGGGAGARPLAVPTAMAIVTGVTVGDTEIRSPRRAGAGSAGATASDGALRTEVTHVIRRHPRQREVGFGVRGRDRSAHLHGKAPMQIEAVLVLYTSFSTRRHVLHCALVWLSAGVTSRRGVRWPNTSTRHPRPRPGTRPGKFRFSMMISRAGDCRALDYLIMRRSSPAPPHSRGGHVGCGPRRRVSQSGHRLTAPVTDSVKSSSYRARPTAHSC